MTTIAPADPDGPLHRLGGYAWQTLLALGVLTVGFGVAFLVWPGKTLLVAGLLFGSYLVFTGVMQLLAAFGGHQSVALRVLAFLAGMVSIVLGVFCFRDEFESIMLLAVWIGIGWMFRGITAVIAALAEPGLPGRGWQAALGTVIALGGSVLIAYPFDSIAFLTLMAGWWLILIGVLEVLDAFQLRRALAAAAAL